MWCSPCAYVHAYVRTVRRGAQGGRWCNDGHVRSACVSAVLCTAGTRAGACTPFHMPVGRCMAFLGRLQALAPASRNGRSTSACMAAAAGAQGQGATAFCLPPYRSYCSYRAAGADPDPFMTCGKLAWVSAGRGLLRWLACGLPACLPACRVQLATQSECIAAVPACRPCLLGPRPTAPGRPVGRSVA